MCINDSYILSFHMHAIIVEGIRESGQWLQTPTSTRLSKDHLQNNDEVLVCWYIQWLAI